MRRRESFAAIAGLVFSACEMAKSVAAPSPPPKPPSPVPRIQLVPATGKYAIEAIANENIPNVAEALQLAGLTLVIKDQGNWTNIATSGTFAGGLIQRISNTSGNWRVDIDGKPFCTDVRSQPVRAGNRISCFTDDGIRVQGSCFG